LIGDAATVLGVPVELITPRLDELAAAEEVVREAVPAPALAAAQVPAVYLPPFSPHQVSLLPSGCLHVLAAVDRRRAQGRPQSAWRLGIANLMRWNRVLWVDIRSRTGARCDRNRTSGE